MPHSVDLPVFVDWLCPYEPLSPWYLRADEILHSFQIVLFPAMLNIQIIVLGA